VLAKSGRGGPLQERISYRHEFGSLIDIVTEPEFQEQPEEVQELVLHLIATHHGRARPHFSLEEAFDPQAEEQRSAHNLGIQYLHHAPISIEEAHHEAHRSDGRHVGGCDGTDRAAAGAGK
jgi:hypothetical protein